MGIETFIRDNVLAPRLREDLQLARAACLVVYDPDFRYRDICLSMATDKVVVVDATESSIESREKAQQAFQQLGKQPPEIEGLLIYVPAKPPN